MKSSDKIFMHYSSFRPDNDPSLNPDAARHLRTEAAGWVWLYDCKVTEEVFEADNERGTISLEFKQRHLLHLWRTSKE